MQLAQLATLPTRQTPLYLGSSSHVEIKFDIVAPEAIPVPATLPQGEAKYGDCVVRVKDDVHGHDMTLDRLVDIPAGRVQPGKEYADFLRFVQQGDALVEKEIVIGR
jgi:hypothetical protein